MSSDGAHLGVCAGRALETILGGKPAPEESETETPAQVRARITAAARRGGDPAGYGDCADMVAGMVLEFCAVHPDAVRWPVTPAHHWERDGIRVEPGTGTPHDMEYVTDGPDLYREVDAFTDGKLGELGITGFQWGWAVNAARYAEYMPPEPNPALLTVTTSEETP